MTAYPQPFGPHEYRWPEPEPEVDDDAGPDPDDWRTEPDDWPTAAAFPRYLR